MYPSERSRSDRQAEVAEAVWRVLDRDGFVGLSLRVVAAEMGATTGTVTHYFPSKDALADYALELLASRRAEGETATPAEPLAALRMALLGMLPLDPTSRSATRIWVSSWDAALADSRRATSHAQRYRDSRDKLTRLVADAMNAAPGRRQVDRDPNTTAELLHAAMLGLATQAVLDPVAYPPERLAQLVDDAIARAVADPIVTGQHRTGDSTPAQASGS